MAYNSPSRLGMQMPPATIDPVEVDDLERQRKALKSLGLDEGWLGDVNKWRTEKMGARDAARDDLRERLLGGGGSSKPNSLAASAVSGGISGAAAGGASGAASEMARSAAKSSAMSAMGAAL